ncbi:MAG: xanthine phosphoribosyltransferase [Eggerthella lenta]
MRLRDDATHEDGTTTEAARGAFGGTHQARRGGEVGGRPQSGQLPQPPAGHRSVRRDGRGVRRLFADAPITKILTIEASGIGIACVVARHFGVPVVFAKKAQSINLDGEMFTTRIESFTHGRVYDVIVSKKFLNADDHVLIIDDFLANGCALNGLIELVGEAGATVEGIGIAIEKGFQPGGDDLRDARLPPGDRSPSWSAWTRDGEIAFR